MAKSPKDDLKYLEAKLKKNPNSILFARLADAYASIDRIDDSIQICENGLRKHPYYVTGHYIISKCYLKKKQFDHAEKELKRVLLFDPEYIAAHRDYGDLMAQIGWNSSCERSYEKIQSIDPFNKKAKEKIKQIKENLKLDDDPGKELDVDLNEFEEDAIVTEQHNQSEESEEDESLMESNISASDDYDNFDDLFDERKDGSKDDNPTEPEDTIDKMNEQAPDSITDNFYPEEKNDKEELSEEEENEKFTYILDDIFREDNIKSDSKEDNDSNDFDKPLPSKDQEELPEKDEDDISQFTLDEIDRLTEDEMNDQDSSDSEEEEIFAPDDEDPTHNIDEDFDESAVENLDKWLDSFKSDPDESSPDVSQFNEHDQQGETASEKPRTPKKEKIVTPTLGEIYAAQHQYAKAIGVYEILKKNNPDNPMYEQKIEYFKRKLEESQED